MTAGRMATLRELVLRWNRNFSLVSRQDPERQTDELIEECLASGRVLAEALAAARPGSRLRYVDLGTGGGFPGLVWHHLLTAHKDLGPRMLGTDLVEPRSKRAWFLEQASRAMGFEGLDVWEQGWGPLISAERADDAADLVVISMKALRLTDEQVMEGWRSFAGPAHRADVFVVRFVSGWRGDPLAVDPPVTLDLLSSLSSPGPSGYLSLPYRSHRPDSALLISSYPAL